MNPIEMQKFMEKNYKHIKDFNNLPFVKSIRKDFEIKFNQMEKDLETLKKNGITVYKKGICLGSQFNFDFTWIQKLNARYQNEIERLEKRNDNDLNEIIEKKIINLKANNRFNAALAIEELKEAI